jgi:hypothetical protein
MRFGFPGRGRRWPAVPEPAAPEDDPPLVTPPPLAARAVAGPPSGANALRFRTRVARFLALAVDAGRRSAFAAGEDGSHRHYSYPEFRLLGTYSLASPAYRAVLDGRRGLLYVAVSQPRFLVVNALGDPERARGDLEVYDVRAVQRGEVPAGATLQPRARLPLGLGPRPEALPGGWPERGGGHVYALALGPSGEDLYYLASASRAVHVARVDTGSFAREDVVPLPNGPGSLAVEGRTLYATSPGELRVLEGRPLRVTRRLAVPGAAPALAAGPAGRAFVAGGADGAEVVALDVARGRMLGRWALPARGRVSLNRSGDGRRLYLGASAVAFSRVLALRLPDGDGPPRLVGEAVHDRDGLVTGASVLSPDGRFLMNSGGKVYEVGGGS